MGDYLIRTQAKERNAARSRQTAKDRRHSILESCRWLATIEQRTEKGLAFNAAPFRKNCISSTFMQALLVVAACGVKRPFSIGYGRIDCAVWPACRAGSALHHRLKDAKSATETLTQTQKMNFISLSKVL